MAAFKAIVEIKEVVVSVGFPKNLEISPKVFNRLGAASIKFVNLSSISFVV
jgi:hypothetical protein